MLLPHIDVIVTSKDVQQRRCFTVKLPRRGRVRHGAPQGRQSSAGARLPWGACDEFEGAGSKGQVSDREGPGQISAGFPRNEGTLPPPGTLLWRRFLSSVLFGVQARPRILSETHCEKILGLTWTPYRTLPTLLFW